MNRTHPKMYRIQEPEEMTEEEENFYQVANYDKPHQVLTEKIVSTVNTEVASVLDIGCGPGDILIRIRSLQPNWELFGLDISPNMLEFARKSEVERLGKSARSINWINGNGRHKQFEGLKFDAVLSNSVLHHMSDPIEFWKRIKGYLNRDGWVFVRDLRRPETMESGYKIIEDNIANESQVVKDHYLSSLQSSYTVDEVNRQLEIAGIDGLVVEELEDRYLDIYGRCNDL